MITTEKKPQVYSSIRDVFTKSLNSFGKDYYCLYDTVRINDFSVFSSQLDKDSFLGYYNAYKIVRQSIYDKKQKRDTFVKQDLFDNEIISSLSDESSRAPFSVFEHKSLWSDILSSEKSSKIIQSDTNSAQWGRVVSGFTNTFYSIRIDTEGIDTLETEFVHLKDINRDGTLNLIQSIFISNLENKNISIDSALKIIRLIQRFDYDELFPYAQFIITTAIHVKNPRIQLEALNTIDRWADKRALNLLYNLESPLNPWVKTKYESLKKTYKDAVC